MEHAADYVQSCHVVDVEGAAFVDSSRAVPSLRWLSYIVPVLYLYCIVLGRYWTPVVLYLVGILLYPLQSVFFIVLLVKLFFIARFMERCFIVHLVKRYFIVPLLERFFKLYPL